MAFRMAASRLRRLLNSLFALEAGSLRPPLARSVWVCCSVRTKHNKPVQRVAEVVHLLEMHKRSVPV